MDEGNTNSVIQNISGLFDPVRLESLKKEDHGTKPPHICTGFIDLDDYLCGLRGGQLTAIAGRPGIGKSSFALQLAINAAKMHSNVAFFSPATPDREIAMRILAQESLVSLNALSSGVLDEQENTALKDASDCLKRLPLYFDDTPLPSILHLRAKAKRIISPESKNLIIVDYLQLLRLSGRCETSPHARAKELGKTTYALKAIAKELDVPVVALVQLPRVVESHRKKPVLYDLRNMGPILQDFDVVLLGDRSQSEEEAAQEDRPDYGIANFVLAKNRNGKADVEIKLAFYEKALKFADYFDSGLLRNKDGLFGPAQFEPREKECEQEERSCRGQENPQ